MFKALLSQSFIYGVTTLASRGSIVILLLALSLVLKPAEYGVLAMITTLAALVNLFVPLEITQGLVRLYAVAPPREKPLYSSSAFKFTAASVCAYFLVAQLLAAPLCRWIFGPEEYLPALRIGLGFMGLNTLFYFLQNQFRWEFRPKGYAVISVMFSLLTFMLSLGFALLSRFPLEGVLVGQVLGAAAAVAWGGWHLRLSVFARFERAKLREMLTITIPLVPASISFVFSQYAGRFILNDVAGLEAVGVFSFASQIAGVSALALIGVQNAVTPLIMAHFQDPDTPAVLGRSFQAFTGLGFIVALGLGLFSPELILFLGNPKYTSAAPLVLLLALSVIVVGLNFFLPGFMISKKTTRQMWVSVVGVGCSIGMNYLLATRYGALGAAVATLLAATIFMLLWYLFSRSLYPVPVRWGAVAASAAVTLLAGEGALSISYPSLIAAVAVKALSIVAVTLVVVASGLIPLADLRSGAGLVLARLRPQRHP
jgi:O-antigen/teichoic acid export membrane protein